MKKSMQLVSVIAIFLIATAFKTGTIQELAIGSEIPKAGHKMMDVTGKEVSLADVKGENGIINGINDQNVRAQPYSTSQRVDVHQHTGITELMPLCVQLEIAVSQPLQEVRAAELYAAVNSLRHSHGLKSHLKCKFCTLSLLVVRLPSFCS